MVQAAIESKQGETSLPLVRKEQKAIFPPIMQRLEVPPATPLPTVDDHPRPPTQSSVMAQILLMKSFLCDTHLLSLSLLILAFSPVFVKILASLNPPVPGWEMKEEEDKRTRLRSTMPAILKEAVSKRSPAEITVPQKRVHRARWCSIPESPETTAQSIGEMHVP